MSAVEEATKAASDAAGVTNVDAVAAAPDVAAGVTMSEAASAQRAAPDGTTRLGSDEGDQLLILAPLRIEALSLRRGAGVAGIATKIRRTGMGPKAAARTLPPLEAAISEGPVAVAGFCGAIKAGLNPGDMVVATEVHGPGGIISLSSAPVVAQTLRMAGLTVHTGPVISVNHLLRGRERAGLAAAGFVAADMESYWLLKNHPGRQACVMRSVSDGPDHGVVVDSLRGGWLKAYRSLARARVALETWSGAIGPRSVIIAAPRSFCGGVEAAIETTEEVLQRFGAPIYVLHEIVHNKHVVDSFRERGVIFVHEVDEVPKGQTVVFSAHGVGQAVRQRAKSRELRVIDATCPLVARVHAKAKHFAARGHAVVLIGKKGHDEIEGVMGEAPESIHLVEGLEDIERLDLDGRATIAVLTQTTLIPHQVDVLVDALRRRFPDVIVPAAPDICYASQNRQEAVRTIAPQCDLLLVLGSTNSSNSKRLVEEARRMGTPARLVDDESEIDLAWLAGVRTLGLTAGASAPESLVERTIDFVGALGPVQVREQVVREETSGFPTKRGPRSWESR